MSRDGEQWFLLNCSPDLRQQIVQTRLLWPKRDGRHSPIAGAVLTNGDVDHIGGLINLRESQPLVVHATRAILETLADNSIMKVLNPDIVTFRRLHAGYQELHAPDRPSGLHVEMFSVPGKTALYLEGDAPEHDAESEQTVGLRVSADGKEFFYVPGCARITPALRERLNGASAVFWDGTLWRDDEMIQLGVGAKTGRRMGHMSMDGPEGSIDQLGGIDIERRIFVHLNNTNPVLREDSDERARAQAAGWEIAYDGMEVRL